MNLLFYLLFIDISREKSKCHLLKGDTEELYNFSNQHLRRIQTFIANYLSGHAPGLLTGFGEKPTVPWIVAGEFKKRKKKSTAE